MPRELVRDADRAAVVVVVLFALLVVVSVLADGCCGRLAPLDAAEDASAEARASDAPHDVLEDLDAPAPRDAGCDIGVVLAFSCDCRVGAPLCPADRPCGVHATCKRPFVLDRGACTIVVREAGLADCAPRDDAGGLCCPTWDGWDGGL